MTLIKQIFTTMLIDLMFGPHACAARPGRDTGGFDQQDHAEIGFGSDGCEAHQQQAEPNS
jgi:hypothetical protein